jgi:chromosome segregation ATPase
MSNSGGLRDIMVGKSSLRRRPVTRLENSDDPEGRREEGMLLLQEILELRREMQALRDQLSEEQSNQEKQEMTRRLRWKPKKRTRDEESAEACYDLHKRQPELQTVEEVLEDQKDFLRKYFGKEARNRIRKEVNWERTTISELKEELKRVVEDVGDAQEALKAEMNSSQEEYRSNKECIRVLTRELEEAVLEGQGPIAMAQNEQKKHRQEVLLLSDEVRRLESEKLAKQREISELERRHELERTRKEKLRIRKFIRDRSVYKQSRFGGRNSKNSRRSAEF